MKAKTLKIAGLITVLAAFAVFCIVAAYGQPTPPASSRMTIDWSGYLVVGKPETMDKIGRGFYPATDQKVEIGLRSDGVVVWRIATNIK